MLERSEKSLNNDIIDASSFAIHRYLDIMFF
jgi:hypothetical protein